LVCPPTPTALCAILLLGIGLTGHGFVFFVLPAFALIILLAAQHDGWMANALSLTAVVWLGEISYSLYLTHWPLMQLSNWLLSQRSLSPSDMVNWNLALVVVITITAVLTHRWIEIPARIWTRRITQPRKVAADFRKGTV
jgi:peptidoglycan/LPS O-acetylase OafA/YrhL